MRDAFSSVHPGVAFLYFALVILGTMVFMHPVLLAISLACAAAYSIYLNGMRAVRFNLLGMVPLLLLFAVMNPVFNHAGVTVLGYVAANPVTLESIVYGVASGAMFVSVIIWFSCYNAVINSDKLIFLFGRAAPALSLLLAMVLRLVPRLKAQARAIAHAQRGIGCDASSGGVVERARHGLKIISILTSWALENSIDTADSMRSRGYGLPGRTSFSTYRFTARDAVLAAVLAACGLVVCAGAGAGASGAVYFPQLDIAPITPLSAVVFGAWALLCLLPLVVDCMEDLTWARLKSRA